MRLATRGEKVYALLAVVVVQIHAPRTRGNRIREQVFLRHVPLAEDPVAEQTARLALTEQVRTKRQHAVRVDLVFLRARKSDVDREQQTVADRLAFRDHVAVDAVLPVPLAVHRLLALRERLRPRRGERHGRVAVFACPHERRAKRVAIRLFRCERLVELPLRLASHAEVGASPETHPAVARRVAEERRRKTHHAVTCEVKRLHGGDAPVRALLHANRARRETHFQIGRLAHDVHPARVRQRGRRRPVHERAAQLAHEVVAFFACTPHADFRRGVAAQHGTILHQHRL